MRRPESRCTRICWYESGMGVSFTPDRNRAGALRHCAASSAVRATWRDTLSVGGRLREVARSPPWHGPARTTRPALYGHDIWLHAGLALVGGYFGFMNRQEGRFERA
jgi:hypothetical protein